MKTILTAAAALAFVATPAFADDGQQHAMTNDDQPTVEVTTDEAVTEALVQQVLERIEQQREAKRQASEDFWASFPDND